MREQPTLVRQVSAILFRQDPVGINFKDNTDEYDAEAGTIVGRRGELQTKEDVYRVVREEFVRWFGEGYDRCDRLDDAATEIGCRSHLTQLGGRHASRSASASSPLFTLLRPSMPFSLARL